MTHIKDVTGLVHDTDYTINAVGGHDVALYETRVANGAGPDREDARDGAPLLRTAQVGHHHEENDRKSEGEWTLADSSAGTSVSVSWPWRRRAWNRAQISSPGWMSASHQLPESPPRGCRHT